MTDPLAAPPGVMSATYTAGDGIDALRRVDEPTPVPGPRDVLLRVTARSLNFRDLLVVDGVAGWRPERPVVPVSDAVGVVVARGAEVTRFELGDRVSPMFLPQWHDGELRADDYVRPVGGPVNRGMLADFVAVHEDEAARVPRTLSDIEAATLPVAGVTAWHAVAVRGRVAAGETVLVHGTGGVALLAMQFARALGARVAITSGSAAKLRRAARLGAELGIDRGADVAAAVLDWTHGRGADLVIETVGGANLNTSLRAVRIGGRIAFVGLIAGRSAEINTYEFVTKNVTIHGIETGSRLMYEQMAAFVDRERIRPVVDDMADSTDVVAALHDLQRGTHFGKLALTAR